MAISWDAHTLAAATYSSTGTQNTTHAVGANARAAVVVITQDGSVSDEVSGVTFNGVTMDRPIAFDTNDDENGAVYLYFLDGITGQGGNVTVAMTTSASNDKLLSVHTFNTQGAEYSVVCSANSAYATTANPTTTISGLSSGTTYLGVMGVHSSLNAFPNTPGTGWTSTGYADLGVRGWGQGYLTSTTSGVTSLTASWTASADGYVIIAAALSEGARIQAGSATGVTVVPSAAATPADMTKSTTGTGVTVAPSSAATPGATTKPQSALGVTMSQTAAAAGDVIQPGTTEVRTISGTSKTYGTMTGRVVGPPGQAAVTHTVTATGVTVAPTAAAAGYVSSSRTATGVTVAPSAAATPQAMTKSTTGTGVTVAPTAAATPQAMTKSTTGTGVTVAMSTTAVGVVTDSAAATGASVGITSAATPGAMTKPATAAVTQPVTAAAAGVVTDQSTADATQSVTAAASGATTKSSTADATVTITSTAVPSPITDTGTADATVAMTAAASGASSKSSTATGVTVSITAAATPAAISRSAAATGASVGITSAAAGFITDSSTADATVAITAAATPGATAKATVGNTVTVAPTSAATPAAVVKPATATGATVSVTAAAEGTVAKASMADVTVAPVAAAQGIPWRSYFNKPDAILSMTGLTGVVGEIDDSPTAPDADALDPTGGGVDIRVSFESHGLQLRTGTGDQVIRVLASTPL